MMCFLRSIPAFVIHRLDWSIVHPFVHLEENELNELKSQRSYVAGFTNAEVENKSELYDIFLHGQFCSFIIFL